MLQRKQKAEKIKTALSVLEQWKLFFTLPTVMQDSIRKGSLDAAVRAYKKGKYLMDSSFKSTRKPTSPSHLLSVQTNTLSGGQSAEKDSSVLPQKHRPVFEKVWLEVEKTVSIMRLSLQEQLQDPSVSFDRQELAIQYLVDLDSSTDPVLFYLECQYKWIIEQLVSSYNSHIDRLKKLREISQSIGTDVSESILLLSDTFTIRPSVPLTTKEFKRALLTVDTKAYEEYFVPYLIHYQTFGSYVDFSVKADFKSAKQKKKIDIKKLEQCQNMFRMLLKTYCKMVDNIFYLSFTFHELQDRTVFASTHFGAQIISEQTKCLNCLRELNIGTIIFSNSSSEIVVLKTLAETIHKSGSRIIDSICHGVLNETKNFHRFEEWKFESESLGPNNDTEKNMRNLAEKSVLKAPNVDADPPEKPILSKSKSETTTLPRMFYNLVNHTLIRIHKILSMLPTNADIQAYKSASPALSPKPSDVAIADYEQENVQPVKQEHLDKIKATFFESFGQQYTGSQIQVNLQAEILDQL
ncbi:exocyst complex component Sec5-domain-containing protein [Cladochytrium replicatum]|nr:exocyst complex component Sec5-domain-containing protein [Cladochytrium replicatum]